MYITFVDSGEYGGGCTDPIEPRACGVCPAGVEKGNVNAVGFIEEAAILQLYSPSDTLNWLNLIKCGKAFPVPMTRGTFAGTKTTGPGFGRTAVQLINGENVLTYEEAFDCRNRKHYEGLMKNPGKFRMFMVLDKHMRLSQQAVTVSVTSDVGDRTTQLVWSVTATWDSDPTSIPECFDIPKGIFDDCATLQTLLAQTCELCPDDSTNYGPCPTDPAQLPAFKPVI